MKFYMQESIDSIEEFFDELDLLKEMLLSLDNKNLINYAKDCIKRNEQIINNIIVEV